jgi:anion-transporting  ArsA/GET3 family ATPase
MEQGFRDRAQEVLALLGDPVTAWVLITTPRPAAVAEALYFAEQLEASNIEVDAVVVNRTYPAFAPLSCPPDSTTSPQLALLVENLRDLSRVASGEEESVAGLTARVPAPVARVPYLDTDVHDLVGLAEVAEALFAPDV